MKQLSQEAFDRASYFIKTNARPLELAQFNHRFMGGPVKDAAFELSEFQNEDGGFGRGLEPDLRSPSSSPLCTAIGLQILANLGYSSDFTAVGKSLKYLLGTYNEARKTWRPISLNSNDFPHAPWWHDEDNSLFETFDGYRIIPRALIVGLMHHFHDPVPIDWLDDVTESTVSDIEKMEQLGTGGGDDLLYTIYLAQTHNLPQRYSSRLKKRILDDVPKVIVTDHEKWDSYVITPLKIAPLSDFFVVELISDAVQNHLDYLIECQESDGSWHPTWSWGDAFPEAWNRAKQEWQGLLTYEALHTLSSYGRIEGDA